MMEFNLMMGKRFEKPKLLSRSLTFISVALFLNSNANAECFIAEGFRGVSAMSEKGYAIETDGIGDASFQISIDGEASYVSPNNLSCAEVGKHNVLCIGKKGSARTVESWTVDPEDKRAALVQTRTGHGLLDGAKLFVGELVSRCD